MLDCLTLMSHDRTKCVTKKHFWYKTLIFSLFSSQITNLSQDNFSWNFTLHYTYAATLNILLFLLSHFILSLSQVLTLIIARNKQSSTSWWSRVTFLHCFFSNCCSDKNVKSSSSNEITIALDLNLIHFFNWVPVQVNISQRYIFQTTALLNGILQSHLDLQSKVDWYSTS